MWGCSMHTGHLASSHSITTSLVSKGSLDDDCLARLELQGKGDTLDLLNEESQFPLSFGILLCKSMQPRNDLN